MIIKPLLVAFELSNRCVYSSVHTRCPVDAKATPKTLPARIVENALEYLGRIDFTGELYFSIYNEPMNDPRLFMFIKLAKQLCPNCRIQLFTNGWNLDQQMVDELLDAGVGMFMVSAYTTSEEMRLKSLNYKVPSDSRPEPVLRIELDDRMIIYDLMPTQVGPCWMPTIYPFVNHLGQFVLCCQDYKYTNTFGDLNHSTFEEVYLSDFRKQVCESLQEGYRFFDVCKRCDRPHLLHEAEKKLFIPLED